MIIQVYAFTQLDQALEAAGFGVDQIGFVAGDYGVVSGELSFSQARRIADGLLGKATRVALTMATDIDEIVRMAAAVRPDIIHISTDPEMVGVEDMIALRKHLPLDIRLMKAIHVTDESTIDLARQYAPVSDLILLDTKVKDMPGVGATGKTHDWNTSRRVVEAVTIPVILAGGLDASNVIAAATKVKPWGVDSNTRTNLAGDPVAKDMQRVREFVQAARVSEAKMGLGTRP